MTNHTDARLFFLNLWMEGAEDSWAFLRHIWADLATTHLPAMQRENAA